MDAELKAKWIEALRSGRYKQGTRFLRSGDEFCCLGVLCDVANVPTTSDGGYLFDDGSTSDGMVFGDLAKSIGGSLMANLLTEINDVDKESFPYIADWIERNVKASAE